MWDIFDEKTQFSSVIFKYMKKIPLQYSKNENCIIFENGVLIFQSE